MEFRSDDNTRGFDPYIPGDVSPSEEPDSDHPEWWTSVCRTPTPVSAALGQENLNVNEYIRVEFGSDQEAALFEVVADPAFEDFLKVTTPDGMRKSTKLKITWDDAGRADTDILRIAVFLYPAGTKAKVEAGESGWPAAARTLHVMVMPEQRLKLGIWNVYDPRYLQQTKSTVAPDPLAMLKRVNHAYRQACVVFDPIPRQDPNVDHSIRGVEYDSDRNNMALDFSEGINLVRPVFPKAGTVNVVLIRNLTESSAYTLPRTSQTAGDMTFIALRNFESQQTIAKLNIYVPETCAHEVGHQLLLSTRITNGEFHDSGPFPDEAKNPLMSTSDSFGRQDWLRHEDWEAANLQAKKIKEKP